MIKFYLVLSCLALSFMPFVNAQAIDFPTLLFQAQQAYDEGEYQAAGSLLQTAFIDRSPRTKELLLAIESFTLANQFDAALELIDEGINSGWLTLETLLKNPALEPLYPTKGWQAAIQRLNALTNGSDEELRQQVARISERDNYYRDQMLAIARDKGWGDPQIREMHGLQSELDAINIKELEEIITIYGYPGRSLVGLYGNVGLIVLQRADLNTQLKYLEQLEAAAVDYDIYPAELAYLVDKIKLAQEEPQVYGTQIIRSSEGGLEFYRVVDPDNINARRRAADLLPIEEYAKRAGVIWE